MRRIAGVCAGVLIGMAVANEVRTAGQGPVLAP
jgi:hypothetical protein